VEGVRRDRRRLRRLRLRAARREQQDRGNEKRAHRPRA
jgi:hypothetical protein